MQRVSTRKVGSAPRWLAAEQQNQRKATLFHCTEFCTYVQPYNIPGETTPDVRFDARREPRYRGTQRQQHRQVNTPLEPFLDATRRYSGSLLQLFLRVWVGVHKYYTIYA